MSLLDNAETTTTTEPTDTTTTPETNPEAIAPSGSDEVTTDAWLNGFESGEALGTAYQDLVTKHTAPETYEYNVITDAGLTILEGVEYDLNGFMGVAKEIGLNQEGFNKVAEYYSNVEKQRAQLDLTARQDAAKEMLGGDKAGERISTFAAKAKAVLNADEYELLQLATSGDVRSGAAAIVLLEKFMLKGETAPMSTATVAPTPQLTKGDLQAMMQDPRYRTDKEFRDKVTNGFKTLYSE